MAAAGPEARGGDVAFLATPSICEIMFIRDGAGRPSIPTTQPKGRRKMLPDKTLAAWTDPDSWFRYNMIYHLQKLDVPGHVYLPLNRDYRPLGIASDGKNWTDVDYMAHAEKAMKFSRDPSTFTDVWGHSPLYMYYDGAHFRADYFARLEKLFGRAVKVTK